MEEIELQNTISNEEVLTLFNSSPEPLTTDEEENSVATSGSDSDL